MKVFISWSGEKSRRIAELIDEWLQCTIQSCQPWLSSRSIDRGALWFSEITAELADTTIGVICLTKENKDKPWILFESGALAKGLNSNRVCTLLIDLQPTDLENPLAQFNHTIYSKDSLKQLLSTINSLSESPLKPAILEKVFEKYWPEFELKFDAILAEVQTQMPSPKRDQNDILTEILNTIRGLDRRMVRIEDKTSFPDNNPTPVIKDRMYSAVKLAEGLLNQGFDKDDALAHVLNNFTYSEDDAVKIVKMAVIKKIGGLAQPFKNS